MNTHTQFQLPKRTGQPPITGQKPPQLQFSDQSPSAIRDALKTWAFANIPQTLEHDTLISVPSSRALWLDEETPVTHENAFMPPMGSREYAHVHEDGSIHVMLPKEIEEKILLKKWGLRHPWYDRGVKEVLVYAPRDEAELTIIKYILIESYRYITGDLEADISLEQK
ncbi:MAG: hypothetical protein GY755_01590 [Chloroflexi bacterium]|nr:hypothetical protein [Chloroflexota bacterium]